MAPHSSILAWKIPWEEYWSGLLCPSSGVAALNNTNLFSCSPGGQKSEMGLYQRAIIKMWLSCVPCGVFREESLCFLAFSSFAGFYLLKFHYDVYWVERY